MKLSQNDWRFHLHHGDEITIRFMDKHNSQHTGIISSIQFSRVDGGDPLLADDENDVLCCICFKDGYRCSCLFSELE